MLPLISFPCRESFVLSLSPTLSPTLLNSSARFARSFCGSFLISLLAFSVAQWISRSSVSLAPILLHSLPGSLCSRVASHRLNTRWPRVPRALLSALVSWARSACANLPLGFIDPLSLFEPTVSCCCCYCSDTIHNLLISFVICPKFYNIRPIMIVSI